ncbi:hypothetical protein B566_EDAN007527 [Ephemera danica]|nr:hypothetical protein B566_EDAN007527 [Ephemera danica]
MELAWSKDRKRALVTCLSLSLFDWGSGSSGTGCEVCGRGGGGGGFNSPVSTAPLAASGGGGGSGLIAAPAPASWCLYCGCTQSGGGTATAVGPGQCSQCSPHRRAVQTLQRQPPSSEQHRGLHRTGRGYYEAEDASAKYQDGGARTRSGQYYSPPGTSYTIVETSTGSRPTGRDVPLREIGFRPITASNRASSQSPPGSHPRHRGKHHMGAPSISPEQVIRMLNSNHHPGAGKHHPHHLRHETHPPGGTTVNSIPQPSTAIANLPVRTVSMVRPHDAAHGFGICVKGGRDSVEVYTLIDLYPETATHNANLISRAIT